VRILVLPYLRSSAALNAFCEGADFGRFPGCHPEPGRVMSRTVVRDLLLFFWVPFTVRHEGCGFAVPLGIRCERVVILSGRSRREESLLFFRVPLILKEREGAL